MGMRKDAHKRGTPAEAVVWKLLQRRQLEGRRFVRQQTFGPYVLDFFCPEEQLVVEVEGTAQGTAAVPAAIEARDEYLREHGLTVLRFDNRAIYQDEEGMLEKIRSHFSEESAADDDDESEAEPDS